MTIEEIKSVSIVQFLESQGYHHVYILKENYWYLSPFRTEASLHSMSVPRRIYGMTLEQAKVATSSIWFRK